MKRIAARIIRFGTFDRIPIVPRRISSNSMRRFLHGSKVINRSIIFCVPIRQFKSVSPPYAVISTRGIWTVGTWISLVPFNFPIRNLQNVPRASELTSRFSSIVPIRTILTTLRRRRESRFNSTPWLGKQPIRNAC